MRNFREGVKMNVHKSTLMPVKGIVTILFDPQLGKLFRTHCDCQNVSLLVCKWTLLCASVQFGRYVPIGVACSFRLKSTEET